MTEFELYLKDLLRSRGIDAIDVSRELQTLLGARGRYFPYEAIEAHVNGTEEHPSQEIAFALMDLFSLDEAGRRQFVKMLYFGQELVRESTSAVGSLHLP